MQGTKIILQNILDGTNAYGWPAAFQSGVLNVTKYTNSGVVLYPCYSASNIVHNFDGSITNVNFGRNFETDSANGLNYIAKLLVQGRDYFNDTLPPYTLLAYPHPLQALEGVSSSNATNPPPAKVLPPSSLIAIPPQ